MSSVTDKQLATARSHMTHDERQTVALERIADALTGIEGELTQLGSVTKHLMPRLTRMLAMAQREP